MKEKQVKCTRCGRHVWYESPSCPWCYRPMTSWRHQRINRWIDIIIIVGSLMGLGAIMATLIGRA